jgi:hypothetical protein
MDPCQPTAIPKFLGGIVEIPRNHPRPPEAMNVFSNLLKLSLVDTLGANTMLPVYTIHD